MNIDVNHHSIYIYRLLYQAADCGHKGEGHWQIKASLQGGSGQGLLQLKISPTLKLENNSLFSLFLPTLIFIQSQTRTPCGIIPIKEHFPSGNDLILFNFFSLSPQPKQKSEIGLIGQGLKAFGKTCAFRLFKVKNAKKYEKISDI